MAPARPSRRRAGVLAGCLIVLAIVLAIVAGIAIYVGLHWKGWTADIMQQATSAIVNESGLPQDQKTQIISDMQKLGNDFKDGKVSLEQMKNVGTQIAESPLIHLAGVQAARQKYIEPSDMTVEEKAAANRSLQRFARGVFENKIPKEAIDDVVKPITTLKPDGKWELKDKPTRQEVDQFVANAKTKADDAKVPDEAFDLNIAAELKKAIDKALGKTGPV